MNRRGQVFLLGLLWAASFLWARADSAPSPSYPREALVQGQEGKVVVSVTFGADGRVTGCEVVQASASKLLQDHTCAYIREHWHVPSLAGRTVPIPIQYRLPLPSGYSFHFVCTVGADGHINQARLLNPVADMKVNERARYFLMLKNGESRFAAGTVYLDVAVDSAKR